MRNTHEKKLRKTVYNKNEAAVPLRGPKVQNY